ncbi:putative uncharacterized protein DDB_G0277255 [Ipomoea triloba]|uniref:putative uncharacterized protein DDB_G0277255 n=1 Tax=Ipomoea triloba TaxID=35885 RepID=UPI00125DEE28|nr:putative uncharacterized protein DDB_G0277255 [Ipomoea triloba]
MAACENPQNILDKPLPEIPTFLGPLSPSWNPIAAIKPLQKSSFAEIFGELLFKEQHQQQPQPQSFSSSVFSLYSDSSASSSSSSSSSTSSSLSSSSSSAASDIEAEIEMFNNETCGGEEMMINKSSEVVDPDEAELMISDLGIEERAAAVVCRRHLYAENRCSEWKRSKMIRAAFPPPISCIGRSGKPWVLFKSYRGDGRFILKEIRIPTQEFMHACRKDGRLKLHIIQSDDEIPDEDEDEEDNIDILDDDTTEDDEEILLQQVSNVLDCAE